MEKLRKYVDIVMEIEHSHCPFGCDHPQSFKASLKQEELLNFPEINPNIEYDFCGRCWHLSGILSIMISCTPNICKD